MEPRESALYSLKHLATDGKRRREDRALLLWLRVLPSMSQVQGLYIAVVHKLDHL